MLTYFLSLEHFEESVLAEIASNCIDSKWNECTSLQLRYVNLPVRKSEWKSSVMKVLSTSTSPSEIYGQINLHVEIRTPSNLGHSTIIRFPRESPNCEGSPISMDTLRRQKPNRWGSFQAPVWLMWHNCQMHLSQKFMVLWLQTPIYPKTIFKNYNEKFYVFNFQVRIIVVRWNRKTTF